MSKSPAFQFYPADFLSDFNVIVMSADEVGAYALLMSMCWLENGIVNDLDEMARASKMGEKFAESWEKRMGRCFVLRDDGRWDHPRLQAERVKQQEFSGKMREAALRRHSQPSRRQKTGTKKALPKHQDGYALQSSSSISTPPTPSGRDADVERIIVHYQAAHPRRKVVGDKPRRVVRKALANFTADELCIAIDGNARDAWHVEHGKHELSYVLRDEEKISTFIDRAAAPTGNGTLLDKPRRPGVTSDQIDW